MKPLSGEIKFFYGMGAAAQGTKDAIAQVFLFFYFSQLLGLDAALAGTASVLALLVDAFTDPLVGAISDKWKSKWGRRHPLMALSALPLGASIVILFMPPEGLGQAGLFWWMTICSILVHVSLTLFTVPYRSLVAEMTTDYQERTTLMSVAIMIGTMAVPIVIIVAFIFFFSPQAGQDVTVSNSLLNASAYPKFAIFCGIITVIFIMLTTIGTREVIPHLPKQSPKQADRSIFSTLALFPKFFRQKSFSTLVLYTVIQFIGIGMSSILLTYYATYYFEFSETDLAVLALANILGAIVNMFLAPWLSQKVDKRNAAIIGSIGYGIFITLPFNLRLLGLGPENGESMLLWSYFIYVLIANCFLFTAFSVGGSMMADVASEYELKTGDRQEGMFFAAMTLCTKTILGLGSFLSGILLTLIAFPKQAALEEVPPEAITGLGIIGGPFYLFLQAVAILFLISYPINKKRYKEIRRQLEDRIVPG